MAIIMTIPIRKMKKADMRAINKKMKKARTKPSI